MSLAEQVLSVQASLARREADPLSFWRFAVPRLRDAFALFTGDDPIDELHLRACNKGTKTQTKAAFMVACLQKRKHLDGVPIPQWSGRVEGLQLVIDFPQQLLSVKAAYLKVLGNWPCHARWNGEHLTSLHIMPVGGSTSDESRWSVLYFMSQKNVQSGTGARADVIDFDEPPRMDFLRELRKAGHAGRRSIIMIGETPLKRREWAPLKEDYGETPRRSLRRVDRERAEVRWSLDEVADWVLSDEEKEKLRRRYATDPQRAAREHGDYANTDGTCPFDQGPRAQIIEAMISAWCREPLIKLVPVQFEAATGQAKTIQRVPVEVWSDPRKSQEYYQAIDPSSGVEGKNPSEIQVGNDDTGELCARWNGYLPPFSVGSLVAATHRHYNKAWTDIETMDHWGVNVVQGFTNCGGTNLCYEQRELGPGVFQKETGFQVKHSTRKLWVGCIMHWIDSFGAGDSYAPCPSRAVFDSILDTEIDDRGYVVAIPGISHGEGFVLLGQRLRRLRRYTPDDRELYEPPPSSAEVEAAERKRIIGMIRGDDEDEREEASDRMEAPKW